MVCVTVSIIFQFHLWKFHLWIWESRSPRRLSQSFDSTSVIRQREGDSEKLEFLSCVVGQSRQLSLLVMLVANK